jgi:hypothetical protein
MSCAFMQSAGIHYSVTTAGTHRKPSLQSRHIEMSTTPADRFVHVDWAGAEQLEVIGTAGNRAAAGN